MKNKCTICKSEKTSKVYTAYQLPLFQNRVYNTYEEAVNAPVSDVELVQCEDCGFIFNAVFDEKKMRYDMDYNNEQTYSEYFRNYLDSIITGFYEDIEDLRSQKIVEIGCGKAFFFELLQQKNLDVSGFDPAYEGYDPGIIKDYFSADYNITADLIVLRHTLEHVPSPFDFLHMIKKNNRGGGLVYIEIPDVEWIIKNNAFVDIFNEHCNYFSKDVIASLFTKSKVKNVFNSQYIYFIADLKHLKDRVDKIIPTGNKTMLFEKSIEKYRKIITGGKKVGLWGAASKGVTFLNVLDKEKKYISHIIDANPHKQGKYIGGTGHKIISHEQKELINNLDIIIVMNENYLQEIKKMVENSTISFETLGIST